MNTTCIAAAATGLLAYLVISALYWHVVPQVLIAAMRHRLFAGPRRSAPPGHR
jgi:hypothetical protein